MKRLAFYTFIIKTLLYLQANCWDSEYVATQLLIPIMAMHEEVLYCVCPHCFDENVTKMIQSVQEATLKPQQVLSQELNFEMRYTASKRHMLTVTLLRDINDYDAHRIRNAVLNGRRFYIQWLVIQKPVNDSLDVIKILRYMNYRRYINADVVYWNATNGRPEVFGFYPYPEFILKNKTELLGNWTEFYYNYLQDKLDLYGYELRTPFMQDAPEVIKFMDKHNVLQTQGIHYNILNDFVKYSNGTVLELITKDSFQHVKMDHLLHLVSVGFIDIAAHAYALYQSDPLVDKSYPTQVVDWCLMVPAANSISMLYYPFIPFAINVWLLLLLSWLVLSYCEWHWLKSLGQRRRMLLLANLCQLINIPQPFERPALNGINFIYQSCIYAGGLLVAGYYTSMLGSILTVELYRGKFNEMSDLIKMRLPVMIIDYEYRFLLRLHPTLPTAFTELLQIVNVSVFYDHVYAFNSSYAYFITEDIWRFLNLQQEHLKYAIFEYSPICFGTFHQAMPMVLDCPLWRNLEHFIYRMQSSGLYFYYASEAQRYALEAGILHILKDEYAHTIVGMQHLLIVFIIWAGGMLFAGIVLVMELRWKKLKRSCRFWNAEIAVEHRE